MSIITKGLIGVEDLSLGAGTFTRSSSTGGIVTMTKINLASLGTGLAGVLLNVLASVSTTPYTAIPGQIVLVDATSGNKTVNLPGILLAQAPAGSVLLIKKKDSSANTVTITPAGSEQIDGLSSFPLSAQWQYLGVVSDGTNWQIYTRN